MSFNWQKFFEEREEVAIEEFSAILVYETDVYEEIKKRMTKESIVKELHLIHLFYESYFYDFECDENNPSFYEFSDSSTDDDTMFKEEERILKDTFIMFPNIRRDIMFILDKERAYNTYKIVTTQWIGQTTFDCHIKHKPIAPKSFIDYINYLNGTPTTIEEQAEEVINDKELTNKSELSHLKVIYAFFKKNSIDIDHNTTSKLQGIADKAGVSITEPTIRSIVKRLKEREGEITSYQKTKNT